VAGSSHFMEEEQAPPPPPPPEQGQDWGARFSFEILATIHTTMVKTAHP
jgi:hypothetical protein